MLPLALRPRPLRVLCVEEDPVQRKLFKACLDGLGAEGLFASHAHEAVNVFRHHPVDLVVMDIDLHVADELSAFERIHSSFRGRRVPILAITDNECGWSEDDFREAGFAGLFEKPVEPSRLYHKMDDVLRASNQPPLLEMSDGEAWKVPQEASRLMASR